MLFPFIRATHWLSRNIGGGLAACGEALLVPFGIIAKADAHAAQRGAGGAVAGVVGELAHAADIRVVRKGNKKKQDARLVPSG